MKQLLLRLVCAGEAATGLVILLSPSTAARLLLGADVTGPGIAMARIGAIALMGLGASCWPDGTARGTRVMVAYSVIVAVYMATVGLAGGQVGVLWWPAFATHAILAVLLGRALLKK